MIRSLNVFLWRSINEYCHAFNSRKHDVRYFSSCHSSIPTQDISVSHVEEDEHPLLEDDDIIIKRKARNRHEIRNPFRWICHENGYWNLWTSKPINSFEKDYWMLAMRNGKECLTENRTSVMKGLLLNFK